MLRRIIVALALSTSAFAASADPINVFATGTLTNAFSESEQEWTFSGSFSDDLIDSLSDPNSGTFEFSAADLATLDFSVDGSSINFLAPTANLDSRVVVSDAGVAFNLRFDPGDPYFGSLGSTSNSVFEIFAGDGPYASDFDDLTTLSSFSATSATISGNFADAAQVTSLSVITAVPEVSATGSVAAFGSLLALMAFFWERRRLSLQQQTAPWYASTA